MKEICPANKCTGCGACAQDCPRRCISMVENDEGFAFPRVDTAQCINCEKCVRICPSNGNEFERGKSQFYMAWHKDNEVLKRSSSGGVFTALAEYILDRGGIVVGAAEDKDTKKVVHAFAESINDLDKLRLSKYCQSDTRNTYNEVKDCLNDNRYVLFTGTACQISGLYAAIGSLRHSKFLITADVLCHGVTSKRVVDAYIDAKERKYKKKIKNYSFRSKCDGLKPSDIGMKLEYEDGTYIFTDKLVDTFLLGFNNNLFLRESCYECLYCGTERIADFTIGDFWGVGEERVSGEQVTRGVSLMLVNSDKARLMLAELDKSLVYDKISPNEAIPYNRALICPECRPAARNVFFGLMKNRDYDRLIKRYCFKMYIKYYIKKITGKNYYRVKKLIKGN